MAHSARWRGWIWLGLVLAYLLWPSSSYAQNATPISISIDQVGFDAQGHVLNNGWYPVITTIENTGADIQAHVVVETGFGQADVRQTIDLPGGARKQVRLLLRANLNQTVVTIKVLDQRGNQLALNRSNVRVHDSQEVLVGVFGGPASSLAGAAVPGRLTTIMLLDPAQLPSNDGELFNFGAIVLQDVQPSAEQAAALERWVATGGTLIVSGGPNTAELPKALTALLPGSSNSSNTSAVLTSLNKQTVPQFAQVELKVNQLTPNTEATTLGLGANNEPLLVSRKLGMGHVLLTAFNPSDLPAEVNDRRVWPVILQPQLYRDWNVALSPWSMQIRGSDQNLPSVLGFMGILFGYILLIGPINYFVLRRLDRREWAWFTIPLIVLGFVGIMYVAGGDLRTGNISVTTINVVDSQLGSQQGRVSVNYGFNAGRRGAWNGSINSSLTAGNQSSQAFGDDGSGTIEQTSDGQTLLPNWQSNIGDMQTLAAIGAVTVPYNFEVNVAKPNSWEGATITNRSQRTVENAVVYAGEDSIVLPTLAPGQSVTIDNSLRNRANQSSPLLSNDQLSQALQLIWSAGNERTNYNGLPKNSLYTAPHITVLDTEVLHEIMVDGLAAPQKSSTIYNLYVDLEQR
ncbi:hypothetical protein [Herpetosiphon geysericola]|uniref:DUF4350 domain-containing protein n=1 Tax=Herpetosiphon geysericola TaxID=70996 RepID=A0A0P6XWI2_9CHLR|nr:hypothetical protein [Herpetosiphon geysericola]KPL88785.1 hypothetical protein SE18_08840 [Herpetosiphon geysericola]